MVPSDHQDSLSSLWIKHFRLMFRKDRGVLPQGKCPLPSITGLESCNEKEQVDVCAFDLSLPSLVLLIAAGGGEGGEDMGR